MKIATKDRKEATKLAKRIFWLAYQAAGGPTGMGLLQARQEASEEDVWKNVSTNGDYCHNPHPNDKPYGDYVFGRMLKVGVQIKDDGVEIRDGEARWDYQSWARTYKTFESLAQAAHESLGEAKRERI